MLRVLTSNGATRTHSLVPVSTASFQPTRRALLLSPRAACIPSGTAQTCSIPFVSDMLPARQHTTAQCCTLNLKPPRKRFVVSLHPESINQHSKLSSPPTSTPRMSEQDTMRPAAKGLLLRLVCVVSRPKRPALYVVSHGTCTATSYLLKKSGILYVCLLFFSIVVAMKPGRHPPLPELRYVDMKGPQPQKMMRESVVSAMVGR